MNSQYRLDGVIRVVSRGARLAEQVAMRVVQPAPMRRQGYAVSVLAPPRNA
jgi:methyl coenzyme M reductase subunit D